MANRKGKLRLGEFAYIKIRGDPREGVRERLLRRLAERRFDEVRVRVNHVNGEFHRAPLMAAMRFFETLTDDDRAFFELMLREEDTNNYFSVTVERAYELLQNNR